MLRTLAVALALLPLHAEPDRGAGGRVVDSAGREVVLRGVNVNALAEYWKGTRFPTVFGLAADDPRRMRAIGWNAVRVLVTWSRVEPRPGRYDEAYIRRIKRTVRRLQRQGIYTIVDMHQDAWGPTLAARPGETCPVGQRALGWDGAPAWATYDDGQPRCVNGPRESSPAVARAWQSFWADRNGIQRRFAAMWGHLARRLARSPAVAGYDVLNEPAAFGAGQEAALSRMYARVLRSIRRGERRGRGFRHLVLFEPSVLFSATGRGAPPRFTRDRNVVYAPHIYTGGFTNGPITREAFATVQGEARALGGVPVLSGEWGADPDRAGRGGDGYFADHQALQDRYRFGATLWTWRESCGDPHKVGDFRAGRLPEVWGEWEVDCRDNSIDGPRRALVRELTRGAVRAAPGRLASVRWDPAKRRLSARGRASRRDGRLVAFVPARRVLARGSGLTRLRVTRSVGGAIVTALPRGGRWSLAARAR